MKKIIKNKFFRGGLALAIFAIWTVLIAFVDVQAIGPENSGVGFATANEAFHQFTGVHMWMYDVSDLLSLIPLGIIGFFGLLGLVQWIRRKSFLKVDFNILMLGAFYIAVMAFFVFFEIVEVNYRPILIEGVLEASYPSSTTMLMMCVMPTAAMECKRLIQNKTLCKAAVLACDLFMAAMVVLRLFSGVHWLTDIIGGGFLSSGLVYLYEGACGLKKS